MAKKKDFMNPFNEATQLLPTSKVSEQERIKQNIAILPELEQLIPPLSTEEFGQLESNILEHGCKDALMIWEMPTGNEDNEEYTYILIDGHNRYNICKKHGIDFKISTPLHFDSLQIAKDYMINHQLGRRNLNATQASYLRGLKYEAEKQKHGGNRKDISSVQNEHLIIETTDNEKTEDILAKEFKVSPSTIRRDAQFAKGLEKLPAEIKKEVLQGDSSLSKADVIGVAKMDSDEVENFIEETNIGKFHDEPVSKRLKAVKESSVIDKIIPMIRKITSIEDGKYLINQIEEQILSLK